MAGVPRRLGIGIGISSHEGGIARSRPRVTARSGRLGNCGREPRRTFGGCGEEG